MTRVPLLFILLPCWFSLQAQNTALTALNLLYKDSLGANLLVYQGKQFYGYDPSISGHAFFQHNEWQHASVVYRNNSYSNITARFDLVGQHVVVHHPDLFQPVILESSWLKEFEIGDTHFIRIDPSYTTDLEAGFYELAIEDSVSLYISHTKVIHRNPTPGGLEQWFDSETKFFISNGNGYEQVKSRRHLLKAFQIKKSMIRQFLKANNLNFRAHPGETIKATVRYVNQLYRE